MLRDALFLDLDGSLVEVPTRPDAIHVPYYLADLLYQAELLLDGALALISYRQLCDVDHVFEPYRFAGIGGHGSEIRLGDGTVRTACVDRATVESLHEACCGFIGSCQDVLLEYQSYGIAIHYGEAPDTAEPIREYLQRLLPRVGGSLELKQSESSFHIGPNGHSIEHALCDLMKCAPFFGRRPLYVGNLAGSAGVSAVTRLGGIAVGVGADSPMPQLRFRNSCDVHRMLEALLTRHSWPGSR
jgi:trehalose 6-phosphate phosphatase